MLEEHRYGQVMRCGVAEAGSAWRATTRDQLYIRAAHVTINRLILRGILYQHVSHSLSNNDPWHHSRVSHTKHDLRRDMRLKIACGNKKDWSMASDDT